SMGRGARSVPLERIWRALVDSLRAPGERRLRPRHRAGVDGDLRPVVGTPVRLAVLAPAGLVLLGAVDGPRPARPALAAAVRSRSGGRDRLLPPLPGHTRAVAERVDRRPALHHPAGAVRGDGRRPRRPRIATASSRLARAR